MIIKISAKWGAFWLDVSEKGIYALRFPKKKPGRYVSKTNSKNIKTASAGIRNYLKGKRKDFSGIRIDWSGYTPFEIRVLKAARKIPYGKTLTYGELAKRSGSPQAARAAGSVMAKNRTPILIPCHRVLPKNGGIGNYSAGGGWKRRLLKLEGSIL